jgi:hypothetical protein
VRPVPPFAVWSQQLAARLVESELNAECVDGVVGDVMEIRDPSEPLSRTENVCVPVLCVIISFSPNHWVKRPVNVGPLPSLGTATTVPVVVPVT